jgi:hypothetical protein
MGMFAMMNIGTANLKIYQSILEGETKEIMDMRSSRGESW